MLSMLAASLLSQTPVSTPISQGLVVEGVARSGRSAFATDPVQKEIVEGTWKAPTEGDAVGSAKWHKITADKDGALTPGNPGGSYLFTSVDSPDDHVALLKARGHSMVYFDGEPRMGDPYDNGYVVTPVEVKKGHNEMLFALGRGGIHAALETPKAAHVFNLLDLTMPDIREGEKGRFFGAVIVVNASTAAAKNLRIVSKFGEGPETTTKLPEIPPLSVRKVRVDFETTGQEKPGDLPLKLDLGSEDTAALTLRVRKTPQTYKRTFVSHIDGSVQYFAVNPAPIQKSGQALALSLHGAGVEAIGQADAYSSKDWCNIVCATNRRPYGFDWEGIGREDAMEVLDEASKELKPDPRQIYLCGHSMGGHGTWTVGAHYPDRFAVIFPSAGWESFYTYGGKRHAAADDAMGQIFERSSADSDTALLFDNLRLPAIYGLHGTADDNVPITEIRNIKAALDKKGIEFAGYHEQPGAGHWWDVDPAPGADCVDWKPAFQLMQDKRRTLAADLKPVDFTTVNPGASNTCEWVTVLQQTKPGLATRIIAKVDGDTVTATSTNVAKLRLELPSTVRKIQIDGASIDTNGGNVALQMTDGACKQVNEHTTSLKPREEQDTGPFGQVFNNDFTLVYQTQGTPEENAWSFAKARFDAEQMLVRGNGAPDVIADTEVRGSFRHNAILYGGHNAAWQTLAAGGSPEKLQSSGTALLVIRPGKRVGQLIAGVSGTDLTTDRLTDRMPYFVSGVGFPDWCQFTSDVLAHGMRGVRGAGFFKPDWEVDEANSVWAK